ncbi:MAG: ABC transporter substrate-binding protein [Desulfomonile tiedjei]|uniref:ABC transporter substrate-binding protein n=1 Tax=Desulfomonile tiedjei TaxID=2358 RepID=A0A9D6Z819_9BACT|nr:ABC transporter substrate-binding protein [Desulfomonile tiedjei]
MKTKTFMVAALTTGLLCLMAGGAFGAEVRGVTDTEVKLACLVDFSGPGKYAGASISDAFKDYVAWVNDQGGVAGRKIELIIEDGGILPNTSLNAAKKVIMKDGVFAIPFILGSAGASAILPLCEENSVVMMPHGANKKFFDPGNKWVFVPHTVQYSMACLAVEHILQKNPKARIGMIYQDDGFGREGLEGAQAAAKFMNSQIVEAAPYKMGTIDFSPHMSTLKGANVDWIVLWTYLPQSAAVIKQKTKMGWDVKLISNNTTGVPPLFQLVGDESEGYLLVTPYAPGYMDLPGINKAKEVNKKYGNFEKQLGNPVYPDYLYLAGWGYIAAAVEGLRRAGKDLTPESYIKALEGIKDFDMGGMCPNMTFGPNRHVSSFSSLILRADAKNKRFVIEESFKEPRTPQH